MSLYNSITEKIYLRFYHNSLKLRWCRGQLSLDLSFGPFPFWRSIEPGTRVQIPVGAFIFLGSISHKDFRVILFSFLEYLCISPRRKRQAGVMVDRSLRADLLCCLDCLQHLGAGCFRPGRTLFYRELKHLSSFLANTIG